MEIERKYLIAKLPDHLEQYEHLEIEQAYLCTSPTLGGFVYPYRERADHAQLHRHPQQRRGISTF